MRGRHTGELGNGSVLAVWLLLLLLLLLLLTLIFLRHGKVRRGAGVGTGKLVMARVPASQRPTQTIAQNDSRNRRLHDDKYN